MIVLAMHGAPPTDLPHETLAEYIRLHSGMEAVEHGKKQARQKLHADLSAPTLTSADEERYQELDELIRDWPRSKANDPFYAGSMSLAKAVAKQCHVPVIVGFNEFCTPSLPEALEQAAIEGAKRVVVLTPMLTSGGSHSEIDIPAAVAAAQTRFPHTEFVYAWPFSNHQVASFLSDQAARYLSGAVEPTGWR